MPVVRDDAASRRQPVQLRFPVQFLPQHAALRACRARCRVDVDPLHRREIDHQAAVDRGAAGDVVSAAPHRDFEVQRAGQLDGVGDVGGSDAARNQRRPFIDQPVVHAAGVVVPGVGRLKQLSGEYG